jgi:hypothetical protein
VTAFPQRQIATYEIGWNHLNNQAFVSLQLQGGGQNIELQINGPEELSAIIAILARSPVFLRSDGLVFTGPIKA